MVHRSSQFVLFPLSCSLPPPSPALGATWYGCQVIDGCVRQSHESCFYSEGLPYKPTAILDYWTNKLWASRKSISYIDKQTHAQMPSHTHTHLHTYTDNEMQMGDKHVLKYQHAQREEQIQRKKTGTHINQAHNASLSLYIVNQQDKLKHTNSPSLVGNDNVWHLWKKSTVFKTQVFKSKQIWEQRVWLWWRFAFSTPWRNY